MPYRDGIYMCHCSKYGVGIPPRLNVILNDSMKIFKTNHHHSPYDLLIIGLIKSPMVIWHNKRDSQPYAMLLLLLLMTMMVTDGDYEDNESMMATTMFTNNDDDNNVLIMTSFHEPIRSNWFNHLKKMLFHIYHYRYELGNIQRDFRKVFYDI